jgi:hypothetical protein
MNKREAITFRVAQSAVRQKLRERNLSELKLRGFRFSLSENKGIVHLDYGTTLALATCKWSGPSGRGVGLTSLARHHESLRNTRPD